MKAKAIKLFSETYWFPLLIAAVLIIIRAPSLFYSPRFWAEEGTYYFRHALFVNPLENLFFVRFGYYNLWANLAGSAAAAMPLEWAPLGSTLLAFAFQLLLTLIVIDSRSKLFNTPLRKLVAIVIPIFTLKSTEVWLNSINSQYFAAVAVFLLLLEEDFSGSPMRLWFRRIVLLVCGLSGPASVMLGPVFLYKFWQTRNKQFFIDMLILGTCGLLHVYLLKANADGYGSNRFKALDLSTIASVFWVKSLLLMFLGFRKAENIGNDLRDFIIGGGAPWLAATLWIPLLIVFFFLIRSTPKQYRTVFPLAFFTIGLLSLIGSIGEKTDLISPMSGQRYFWAPDNILNLWLFALVPWERLKSLPKGFKSKIPVILFFWMLILGVSSYWRHFYIPPEYPVWSQEIERYRADPTYSPKIWPEKWDVSLTRDE